MLNLWLTAIVAAALTLLSCVSGAKVLIVTFQQPSHVIMKIGIGVDLINRGHEVYYVLASDFPLIQDVKKTGIRVIHYKISPFVEYPYTDKYQDRLAEIIFTRKQSDLDLIASVAERDCEAMAADESFLKSVKAMNFDLVVVEPYIVNPCHIIVPYLLRIPYVTATVGVFPLAFRLPALPSFYPALIPGPQLEEPPELNSLVDRIINSANTLVSRMMINFKLWGNTTLLRKYAPEEKSWEQLMLRSEVILVEIDHQLDFAFPLLPHVITIAGCTSQPAKSMPDSLETIMKESGKHGVILASFGSSAYRMPSHVAVKFLSAFGRLKEIVLTRMAVPPGVEVPSNVRMLSWLPQNDILGHNKTKLFITHCGSSSQYEAVYHAVPMLGIPMFAEQGRNCARAKLKGISLCLDLLQFTADELHDNIRLLLDNSTYQTTIRRMSEIMRDEPLSGCEKAGHWINHVIKFGGSHLRSPSIDQSLFQLVMMDVIAVFTVFVIMFLAITVFLARICLRKSCGRKKNKND